MTGGQAQARPRLNVAETIALIEAIRIAHEHAPHNDRRMLIWEDLDNKLTQQLRALAVAVGETQPEYPF